MALLHLSKELDSISEACRGLEIPYAASHLRGMRLAALKASETLPKIDFEEEEEEERWPELVSELILNSQFIQNTETLADLARFLVDVLRSDNDSQTAKEREPLLGLRMIELNRILVIRQYPDELLIAELCALQITVGYPEQDSISAKIDYELAILLHTFLFNKTAPDVSDFEPSALRIGMACDMIIDRWKEGIDIEEGSWYHQQVQTMMALWIDRFVVLLERKFNNDLRQTIVKACCCLAEQSPSLHTRLIGLWHACRNITLDPTGLGVMESVLTDSASGCMSARALCENPSGRRLVNEFLHGASNFRYIVEDKLNELSETSNLTDASYDATRKFFICKCVTNPAKQSFKISMPSRLMNYMAQRSFREGGSEMACLYMYIYEEMNPWRFKAIDYRCVTCDHLFTSPEMALQAFYVGLSLFQVKDECAADSSSGGAHGASSMMDSLEAPSDEEDDKDAGDDEDDEDAGGDTSSRTGTTGGDKAAEDEEDMIKMPGSNGAESKNNERNPGSEVEESPVRNLALSGRWLLLGKHTNRPHRISLPYLAFRRRGMQPSIDLQTFLQQNPVLIDMLCEAAFTANADVQVDPHSVRRQTFAREVVIKIAQSDLSELSPVIAETLIRHVVLHRETYDTEFFDSLFPELMLFERLEDAFNWVRYGMVSDEEASDGKWLNLTLPTALQRTFLAMCDYEKIWKIPIDSQPAVRFFLKEWPSLISERLVESSKQQVFHKESTVQRVIVHLDCSELTQRVKSIDVLFEDPLRTTIKSLLEIREDNHYFGFFLLRSMLSVFSTFTDIFEFLDDSPFSRLLVSQADSGEIVCLGKVSELNFVSAVSKRKSWAQLLDLSISYVPDVSDEEVDHSSELDQEVDHSSEVTDQDYYSLALDLFANTECSLIWLLLAKSQRLAEGQLGLDAGVKIWDDLIRLLPIQMIWRENLFWEWCAILDELPIECKSAMIVRSCLRKTPELVELWAREGEMAEHSYEFDKLNGPFQEEIFKEFALLSPTGRRFDWILRTLCELQERSDCEVVIKMLLVVGTILLRFNRKLRSQSHESLCLDVTSTLHQLATYI